MLGDAPCDPDEVPNVDARMFGLPVRALHVYRQEVSSPGITTSPRENAPVGRSERPARADPPNREPVGGLG